MGVRIAMSNRRGAVHCLRRLTVCGDWKGYRVRRRCCQRFARHAIGIGVTRIDKLADRRGGPIDRADATLRPLGRVCRAAARLLLGRSLFRQHAPRWRLRPLAVAGVFRRKLLVIRQRRAKLLRDQRPRFRRRPPQLFKQFLLRGRIDRPHLLQLVQHARKVRLRVGIVDAWRLDGVSAAVSGRAGGRGSGGCCAACAAHGDCSRRSPRPWRSRSSRTPIWYASTTCVDYIPRTEYAAAKAAGKTWADRRKTGQRWQSRVHVRSRCRLDPDPLNSATQNPPPTAARSAAPARCGPGRRPNCGP